jgi:hypothetical protein
MPPRLDPSKPLSQLRALAEALGWYGLEMWQHALEDGQIVTWYSTSHARFYLQINEHPVGNAQQYAAAVVAARYGIHTGFHCFRLADADAVSSLHPWLARRQFKDRKWRNEFARRHRECCVDRPTPRRVQGKHASGEWPPYRPGDSKTHRNR